MSNFYKRNLFFASAIFLLFFPFLTGKAQTVLLTDGFETGMGTNSWTVINYSTGSNNWQQYSWDQYSGSYSAACFPNVQNANNWLFTKALSFTQGKFYEIKYYAKVQTGTSLKLTLSKATTFEAPKTTIRSNFSSTGSFALVKDTIVCENTGSYFIGFQNHSSPGLNSASSIIDDILITELNLPLCNTVSAGTISSTVNSVCANMPFSITNANATVNSGGMRYSWQKSSDNINWSNITNGFTYQNQIQLSQTQSTYYRLTDTCLSSGLSSISNQILVSNSSYLNCYCTPGVINCFNNITFTNVKINNGAINNTSACSPNGYGDFTNLNAATSYRNQNVYVQHSISNPNGYQYYVGVWIDFNHSGSFEANEFTVNGPFSSTINTSQLLVPSNALPGPTRMRLKLKYFFSVNPLPLEFTEACTTNGQSGETEDYLLNIGDAPNCTGAISAGTISGSVTQICPNNNFSISAINTTVYQGEMKYSWQKSTDNINWTNLNNTSFLINPLVLSQNSTSSYRLVDTCLVSGLTSISNVVNVTATNLFNCYCAPNNSNCTSFGIDSISFNTIRNASANCPAGGYSNFTSISTNINNGSNLPIYLKLKPSSATKYAELYIDFNRNGIFEPEEKAFNGVSTTNIAGNVYIPFNVNPGPALMRVYVGNSSSLSPCINGFTIGETEDYTVNLSLTSPANNHFCYYVNQNATGLNNGSNWANAYTSLATAFSQLRKADTIRVAQGTYTPGSSSTNSFAIKDSVIVLGGYPNTGNPTDAQRNSSQYQTFMSGEIGSASTITDNTRIILQNSNTKGSVVDGFIVEKAFDNVYNSVGPISYQTATGILQNMVIRNNFNESNGGGINLTASNISLLNCFFEKDSSSTYYTNTASILNLKASTVNISNSVFTKNSARYLFNVNNSTLNMVNCTVFKNYGFSDIHDTSIVTVQNSIFYNNGNNFLLDTAEFQKDVYSTLNLSNTITEIYTHPSYNGKHPKFIDTSKVAGADNLYFTADDGLTLLNPCSPAINIGNNSFVINMPTDILGNPRIKNGLVDLGAYEVQPPITTQPGVLYVNKIATGLNNGTSWANAFTDLQKAFYFCSDTIKVAMGNYPVSSNDENASFSLSNNRVVIGGYPNTGNPANSQINPTLYPTKFDGYINANSKCRNIISSVNNDSTAKVIGFEIINSRQPNYYSNDGTVKIINKSNPYFENLTLNALYNFADNLMIIKNQSAPKFYNSNFYNTYNPLPNGMGGNRSIMIDKNSSAFFLKSFFGRDTLNTAPGTSRGAQIITVNSINKFDSCMFLHSSANSIQNIVSNSTISNSSFIKVLGKSIFNDSSVVNIEKCVFKDSSTTTFGGYSSSENIIVNSRSSNVVVNRCKFLNTGAGICSSNNSIIIFKNCGLKNARGTIGGFYIDGGQFKFINSVSYDGDYPTYNACCFSNRFLGAVNGADIQIINSTIVSNSFVTNEYNILCNTNATMKFYNSIIWKYGNGLTIQNAENDITTSNNNNISICDIRNSFLFKQNNTITTNSQVGVDPKLFDLTNCEGPDTNFFTNDDALRLCTCSPAVNFGNNSLNSENIDVVSNQRVFNNIIDAGAYELQENNTATKTYFVKENATANGNGTSWASAYNKLQSAVLNNCADTIKIAKGVYKPALYNRDSTFNVYRGLTVLGGYPDTGNPSDASRNTVLYPSILSGDIGIVNDSADNSRCVMYVHTPDTTVTIDGIVIEKGNGEYYSTGQVVYGGGGLKLLQNQRININNCIIRKNYAYQGGGIYTSGSNLTINKTVLDGNFASDGGGLYLNDYYTATNNVIFNPQLKFKNSVISNNKGGAVSIFGGGFYVNNIFENLIIYNNESMNAPGFHLSEWTNVRIDNCLFAKNNKTSYTPGIAINVTHTYHGGTLRTFVNNTIFYSNTINGQQNQYLNPDFNWQVSSGNSSQNIPYGHLNYCILSSGNQTTGGGNGLNHSYTFRDYNNPMGNDGIWMTADDGLQVTACSDNIDHGGNAFVSNIPVDILGVNRIINQTVDIGPYEANGIPPIIPTATITASDTTICSGTQVQFYPTVTGGTSNTSYQWKVNGINVGTNQPFFTASNFSEGDVVKVDIIINNPCVINQTITSNSIIMHVNTAYTATVSISSSANPACLGDNIVFTSAATFAGNNPSYQWKVNGTNVGFNLPTFSSATLNNNDVVTLRMNSSIGCVSNNPVTSNSITQILNSTTAVPTILITSSSTNICAGSIVTFNATNTNGGTNPSYQWQVNGVNAGTNSNIFTTSALPTNAQVKCILTSNATCLSTQTATSNILNITVNSIVAPGINITSSATTICTGSSITFTATPTNGGTTPIYQWQVNGSNAGTNSTSFTSGNLDNNDQVKCILTSNAPCATPLTDTSNSIVVSVNSGLVTSVAISVSNTNICTGTPTTFTATPANGGTNPTYQWKVNGINAGTNSATFTSNTLQNSNQVTVVMTSSLACASPANATSNTITMTVTPASVANAGPDVSICAGSNTQLTSGGGTTYLWSPATGLNNPNIANPIATPATSTMYVLTVSNGSCTSKDTVVVTVTQPATPGVTIITASNNICSGSNASFIAVASNSGANPTYQWQVNGVNAGTNSATFTSNSLQNNAQVKVIVTSNAACAATPTVTSNEITMSVTTLAQPVILLTANVLSVTNADAAATYTWQALNTTIWSNVVPAATGITFLVPQAGEYRVKAEKAACTSYSASQVSGLSNPDSTLLLIILTPNPTNGLITVSEIVPSQNWQSLEVLNLQGENVMPSKNITGLRSVPVNADNLPGGIYFIRLTNEDGRIKTYRFIKL